MLTRHFWDMRDRSSAEKKRCSTQKFHIARKNIERRFAVASPRPVVGMGARVDQQNVCICQKTLICHAATGVVYWLKAARGFALFSGGFFAR
jgi:hypothetical protein